MDDDWGLSMAELDSFERAALAQLEERRRSGAAASCRPPELASSPPLSPVRGQQHTDEGFSSRVQGSGHHLRQLVVSSPAVKVKIRGYCSGRIATESPYNQSLVAALKLVPGHEWDTQQRVWSFPEAHLPEVIRAVTGVPQLNVRLEAVAPLVLPARLGYDKATGSPEEQPIIKPSPQEQNLPQGSPMEPGSQDHLVGSQSPSRASTSCHGQQGFMVRLYKHHDKIAAKGAYNEGFKQACQSVSGRSWDITQRAWIFPPSQLEAAVRAISCIPGLPVQLDVREPLQLPPSCLCRQTTLTSSAGPVPALGGPIEVNPPASTPADQSDQGALGTTSQDPQISPPVKEPDEPSLPGEGWRAPLRCTAKLFPHSSGNVAASFGFYQPLVSRMSSIPGAEWIKSERVWVFPVTSLKEAQSVMSTLPGVQVESLVPLVRRALEATASKPDDSELYSNIPSELEKQLLPFQREGIKFALKRGGKALIADEMGLGKTLQAISIAQCYREEWPVMVVVPSSLRLHWAMAIRQWLHEEVRPGDITVVMPAATRLRGGFKVMKTAGDALEVDGLFYIVSYDAVHKVPSKTRFKVVIADEAHYLKNPKAKRTTACLPFLQRAARSILLTGTPALSRPIELLKLLEALQPSVYRSMREYGMRYCQNGTGGWQGQFGEFRGCSNREELHSLVKATVMVRRRKADVLPQLPPKRRQQVLLQLDSKSMRPIRSLFHELGELKERMAKAGEQEAGQLAAENKLLINKIYLASAVAKVKAVQEYVTTLLEGGCKFLVFAHHQVLLDAMEEKVKNGAGYIRIDGKTPPGRRPELVTLFQEQENVRVALLSMSAAGVGLTLTAASTVVFAEMAWTPGVLVQAEDRAHRIGQANSVNVVYLHAPETIDDMIWDTVGRKLENLCQVMDGEEGAFQLDEQPTYALMPGQRTLQQCTQLVDTRPPPEPGAGDTTLNVEAGEQGAEAQQLAQEQWDGSFEWGLTPDENGGGGLKPGETQEDGQDGVKVSTGVRSPDLEEREGGEQRRHSPEQEGKRARLLYRSGPSPAEAHHL